MVKFISDLQGVIGVKGGFERMLDEVKRIKENQRVDTDKDTLEWLDKMCQ